MRRITDEEEGVWLDAPGFLEAVCTECASKSASGSMVTPNSLELCSRQEEVGHRHRNTQACRTEKIEVVLEILDPKAPARGWCGRDHHSKVCGLEVESYPLSVTPGQAPPAISRSGTRSTGPSPSHPPQEAFTGGRGEERCKP